MQFHSFLVLMCLWCSLLSAQAQAHSPHAPIQEEHYGDEGHNAEYDHEAVLGSKDAEEEFDQLPPEEAKKRLRKLVKKMDVDENGSVSRSELIEWVIASFEKLDVEEAQEQMEDKDKDKDGYVSWEEYLENTYSYNQDDVDKFRKDSSPEMLEFLNMVDYDVKKFKAADLTKDEKLDLAEFVAFLHPYNYEHTEDVEVDRVMKERDTDGDGIITIREFMGDADDKSREMQISEEELFGSYDKNGDKNLDRSEVKQWVLPDTKEMAEEEADHLIKESDKNNDKKLSEQEIVDQHELWVGSQATDYGRNLHDEF